MSAPQPHRLCDPCRIRPAPPAPREQGPLLNVSTSAPSSPFSVRVFSLGDRPSGKKRQKCSRARPECGNRGWAGFINQTVSPRGRRERHFPLPPPLGGSASHPGRTETKRLMGGFQSSDVFDGVLGPLETCSGALWEMRRGLFHQKAKRYQAGINAV